MLCHYQRQVNTVLLCNAILDCGRRGWCIWPHCSKMVEASGGYWKNTTNLEIGWKSFNCDTSKINSVRSCALHCFPLLPCTYKRRRPFLTANKRDTESNGNRWFTNHSFQRIWLMRIQLFFFWKWWEKLLSKENCSVMMPKLPAILWPTH